MPLNTQVGDLLIPAIQSWAGLEVLKNRQIVIYGAGKIGRRVQSALDWFGESVAFFWDLKADIIGSVDGKAVFEPDFQVIPLDNPDDWVVLVTIFSENVAAMVCDKLRQAGYLHVIIERSFFITLLYAECASRRGEGRFHFDLSTCHSCPVISDTRNHCDIFDNYVRANFVKDLAPDREPDLVVPSVGVLVSNRCTLTCLGCNHLRDHYVPNNHVDIDSQQILDDLTRFLAAVDLVNKVVVVGGESLLHPDIERILEGILSLPRIGVVHVITNGTVVPKQKRVLNLLSSERVIVEISGYGDRIPRKFQENVKRFIKRLEEYGVNFHYAQTLQWFDFGGFENRRYLDEELKRVYATCCFISNDIFDGQLFKCSRSAYGTFIGKVPDYPSDYVDIRHTPPSELRFRLVEFFSMDSVKVCQHCNGTSTATIEAGQQVKFVRKK